MMANEVEYGTLEGRYNTTITILTDDNYVVIENLDSITAKQAKQLAAWLIEAANDIDG